MKPNLIITASDKKYGDFLIDHWLSSLKSSVDLKNIDIVVLDYGLSGEQLHKLSAQKVIVFKGKRKGHVVNIRYRDALIFLKGKKYRQVMMCDSGDIIFQKDINQLFFQHKNEFRAVCESSYSFLKDFLMMRNAFSSKIEKDIEKTLHKKRDVNGGIVLAPQNKFKELCHFINKHVKNKEMFGPDQIILSYYLYKNGFREIDKTYNYIIAQSQNKSFKIRKGVFYDDSGNIITIVHNTGSKKHFRPVKNFGHGPEHNKVSFTTFYAVKIFGYTVSYIFSVINKIKKWFSEN